MNLFNNIEKFNYTDPDKKCVSLEEYIIFDDEREADKFLVFKLRNNLIQELHEVRFEITQYDENNNVVEKNVIYYSDFAAAPEELFVPNAKLRANYLCKSVGFKLIYAKFDTAYFEDEVLHANSFNFERYKEQLTREKKKNMTRKELKALKKKELEEQKKLKRENKIDSEFSKIEAQNEFLIKEKKLKSKYLKSTFGLSNSGVKGKTVLANVLVGISLFAVTALTIWTTLAYKNTSKIYYDGHAEYQILSDSTAGLYRYHGNEKNVEVSGTTTQQGNTDYVGLLKDLVSTSNKKEDRSGKLIIRDVIQIEKKCFENSGIESIKFNSEAMTIGEKAFYNCKNLNSVDGKAITLIEDYGFANTKLENVSLPKCNSINEYAFADCHALTTFSAPEAHISENAFANCDNLKSVTIGSTSARTLGELFGTTNEDIPSTLEVVYINAKTLSSGFFYDCSKNISLHLTNPSISFTDVDDLYGESRIGGGNELTLHNDEVVAISSYVQKLNILDNYTYNEKIYEKTYKNLVSLTVNSDKFDFAKFVKNNSHIKEIVFTTSVTVPEGTFTNLTNLLRLEFRNGVTFDNIHELSSLTSLKWLRINHLDQDLDQVLDGRTDFYYLILENLAILDNSFKNKSITHLSLLNCDIKNNGFASSKINYIYFGVGCNYDAKYVFNSVSDLKYCIFYDATAPKDIPAAVTFGKIYSVKEIQRYSIIYINETENINYNFDIEVFFIGYIPSDLMGLFFNSEVGYNKSSTASKYVYTYSDDTKDNIVTGYVQYFKLKEKN